MPEVSLISGTNDNVALIGENNASAGVIFSGDDNSSFVLASPSANTAIINGNLVASSMLIASSVGAQGAQGDNDNAIAYSIALG